MSLVERTWFTLTLLILSVVLAVVFVVPSFSLAININQYSDTINDSRPLQTANHTLRFRLDTNLAPGAYFEITLPPGFETLGTSTFSANRNVELFVNGTARLASSTRTSTYDLVEINPGSPGQIVYTLNTTAGISAGSSIEIKVGNHTSKTISASEFILEEFDVDLATTTYSTTTIPGDIKPIINSSSTGTHKVAMRVFDGGLVANADFHIVILPGVGVGPVDTTEEDPPLRFNGAPDAVTGVTLFVEIFIETNEFAICKYSSLPDVDYFSIPTTFVNTGLIYHTTVVPVTPNTTQTFYIRCIDDEGNFNIDDYILEFPVSDIPTGTANDEGSEEGDGTGSGNSGTGSGSGGGGTEGSADGEAPTEGGTSGGGGSGGGSGGGGGPESGDTAGGGFESVDAPFQSGDARVTISGTAWPGAEVVALVDGREALRVRANTQGVYALTIDRIARGVYTFGVYANDQNQVKSSTFSTSFTVTGARTSALSNINIPPSLKVTPDPVNPGSPATISGYALPNATVTIENEKEGAPASRQVLTTTANQTGVWSITLPTTGFSAGTYKVRAKAEQTDGAKTNFSGYVFYGVGQAAVRPTNADLNRDGKVNLIDFSILLFWWNTAGGDSEPPADISGDGRVNLVDFSILLFNWTG